MPLQDFTLTNEITLDAASKSNSEAPSGEQGADIKVILSWNEYFKRVSMFDL